jgi:3-dehydroquinate synthetase
MKTWMTTTTSNAFTSPYKFATKIELPLGHWLILCDSKLKNKIHGRVRGKNYVVLAVRSGEEIKTFRSVENLLNQISKLEKTKQFSGICIVGGGSLGDAGAFVASIYRRGIRLIQVPTTYLAVVDSAFGGKTAINFAEAKNQLGTFYPAEKTFLVKDLLPPNEALARDAFAEILKMAILKRNLWKKLSLVKKPKSKDFWKIAGATIEAKLEIVKRDPFEKKGERKFLNLGHSFGHLFEKMAPLSHGEAVALGLCFELEFFLQKGKIDTETFLAIMEVWERFFDFKSLRKKLGSKSASKAAEILSRDKKSIAEFVEMPVVREIGNVKLEKVLQKDLLKFLQDQGVLN